jgi:hypothetical protein
MVGKRPHLTIRNSEQIGSKNPMYGKRPWNFETLGICKPNSGTFKKGRIAWNKKIQVQIPEPIEIPIIKPIPSMIPNPVLSEEDKIKIALGRLESRRLQKAKEFELEFANRPKEKTRNNFGMVMCVLEGKFIRCKKHRNFCSNWEFCHKVK